MNSHGKSNYSRGRRDGRIAYGRGGSRHINHSNVDDDEDIIVQKTKPEGRRATMITGAISGLPTLYPPITNGRASVESEHEFGNFASALEIYVRREFGDIADIFKTLEYPKYKKVAFDANELSDEKDPFGLKRKEIMKKQDLRLEKIDRLESYKPRVYAIIKGQLSVDSLERIKRLPGWDELDKNCDCVTLLKRIIATHLVDTKPDEEETKLEARRSFNRCRQQWNESTPEFKKRFDLRIRALETVGEHVLEEAGLAREFLERLDMGRYSELLKDYKNGLHARVDTLDEAFVLANNYVVLRRTGEQRKPIFITSSRIRFKQEKSYRSGAKNRFSRETRGTQRNNDTKTNKSSTRRGPSADQPCNRCGAPDHWERDCPEVKQNDETKDEKTETKESKEVRKGRIHLTLTPDNYNEDDMHEYIYDDDNNMPDEQQGKTSLAYSVSDKVRSAAGKLKSTDVVLDTGGSLNLFSNEKIIHDLRESNKEITVTGISMNAEDIVTSIIGKTKFGEVYYSPRAAVNVLSYSMMKDIAYKLWQEANDDVFRLQMTENSPVYLFKRREGVYVHDENNKSHTIIKGIVAITTVEENATKYTSREVEAANKARELISKLGNPATATVVRMINSGNIMNCPITAKDVFRSENIYGPSVANLKGKTTTHKATKVDLMNYQSEYEIHEKQICHVDIMFIDKLKFLINVVTPINYTFVSKLVTRNTEEIRNKLWSQLNHLNKKGIEIQYIRSDPEKGLTSLEDKLAERGIRLDTTGKDEHVVVAESKIRRIKERVRGYINTLPFKVPLRLLTFLVFFCVSRINMTCKTGYENYNVTPFELFEGRKPDFNKNLKATFGDYAQASRNTVDNTMDTRTDGCIALYDTCNSEGTWYLYNLSTDRVIRRNKFKILPMPEIVIQHLNNMHDRERVKLGGIEYDLEDNDGEGEPDLREYIDQIADRYIRVTPSEPYDPLEEDVEQPVSDMGHVADINTMDEASENHSKDDEIEENFQVQPLNSEHNTHEMKSQSIEDQTGEDDTSNKISTTVDHKYGLRPGRAKPGQYSNKKAWGLHLTVKQALIKLKDRAREAISGEIKQLLDRNAFHGVSEKDIGKESLASVIPSSMFIKEKYRADGTFEKVKARLVAGGHRQDKKVYEGKTNSPTVSTSALFIVCTIAASERRAVATVDIPGAYLRADMDKSEGRVLMRLNKTLSTFIIDADKNYEQFQCRDGSIIVELDKALYGCVQSSKLWYDKLIRELTDIHFVMNSNDRCVLNRTEKNGSQTTIIIHVDDMLITSKDEETLSDVLSELTTKFMDASINRGRKHNYLGMVLDFTKDETVEISMDSYVEEILELSETLGVTGTCRTPGSNDLFKTKEDEEKLDDKSKEEFHSILAKVCYLAKRVRPDCLVACAYLSTRVSSPTERDQRKLYRLLQYLNGSKNLHLILKGNQNMEVTAYIDASYGIHDDLKSHTGIVIQVGGAMVFAKSSKQKLNSKSSTEAELIAASDGCGQVLWTKNFVAEQGYKIIDAVIYQDNKSTITLIKSGKTNSERTRHIATRFFFIKDRLEKKEIRVEYAPTGNMIADILTKPLQGKLFTRMRNALLGN